MEKRIVQLHKNEDIHCFRWANHWSHHLKQVYLWEMGESMCRHTHTHTHTDTSVQSPQDSWVPKLTEPASTLQLCHIYSLRWNWKSQKLTEVETEAGDTVIPHFLFTCPRSFLALKMDWELSWRNTTLFVKLVVFFLKKAKHTVKCFVKCPKYTCLFSLGSWESIKVALTLWIAAERISAVKM